jgi:phage-related baseplate assembly protein
VTTLPEPNFVDRDGPTILRECIERFEALAGRPLEPSQVERLLVDLVAYRETLVRIALQEAAKQNLLAYALYPMIDFLGQLIGAGRLEAQPARTTMQLTLPAALGIDSPVPVGTRFRSKDKKVEFATEKDVTIDAGETETTVTAACRTPGTLGNNYIAGQISELVSTLPFALTGENTTETLGGASEEDTERFRERIPLEVRGISVAGPDEAYQRIARAAHPDILHVAATNPTPGVARLTVLSKGDTEATGLLDLVEAACNPKTVRPMCDTVEVVGTTRVDYALEVELTLYHGVDPEAVVEAAEAALATYTTALSRGHGRSPVRSKIDKALELGGVYSVDLITDPLPTVTSVQTARCTATTVTVVGFTEEEPP